MTRALYASYAGPLYQVSRRSDGEVRNISLLAPGGYANAAGQDAFCLNTVCTITRIYDQSPRHNDLCIEGRGGAGGPDVGAPANALPVTMGGHRVYRLKVSNGVGYRNNTTLDVARNGGLETMYMLTSGTRVNNECCFDYSNAEINNKDTGNGHMDAINISTICIPGKCNGSGPWVRADLENGLFPPARRFIPDPHNPRGRTRFVTALLKNNGQDLFALKVGNAQSGNLTTTYSGGEPTGERGYSPMHQEGAIVLGTGDDNSNRSIGAFFAGVMTIGVSFDAAGNAVQANIVSVGYGAPASTVDHAGGGLGCPSAAAQSEWEPFRWIRWAAWVSQDPIRSLSASRKERSTIASRRRSSATSSLPCWKPRTASGRIQNCAFADWPAYDASLRQRGNLTVWFTDEAIAAWAAEARTTRGGQPWYSPLAILTATRRSWRALHLGVDAGTGRIVAATPTH